ncbi:hypothetical protein MNB_SM-3-1101 [hydrothermal vent metagenome]|uniref:Uncharacterized protein n=1 Tax=hydrothermal vent metagenome TaxID=652676 RepID=A0A1W1D5H6_9ZZZZ
MKKQTEKEELLDSVDTILNPEKKLDFNYFAFIFLLVIFVALLAFPKIYIQQEIYFTSREIAKLKSEHDILKEEHKTISRKIEAIKFKNQVVDTMFELESK